MNLVYVNGDATAPHEVGSRQAIKIVCHICNNIGGWGSGFVLAVSKRHGKGPGSPEGEYRKWYKRGSYEHEDSREGLVEVPFQLGRFQLVPVGIQHLVCNMVAQNETGGLYEEGVKLECPNVNYSSLYECFLRLRIRIETHYHGEVELHMPRIGCGLGGGHWPMVERIIEAAFSGESLNVFVYDPLTQAASSGKLAA